MPLTCEFFAQRAGMEIEIEIEIAIEIEIDWMRLPSGMSPIDPDFDFDFDSSVASRASLEPPFGCGHRPRRVLQEIPVARSPNYSSST